MPVSPEFVARVTETFGAVRPVRVTKMFGGIGIYVGDAFFALGDDDRLYFKVDAQNLPAYEAKGMGPWVCQGRVNQKYRELPADVLSDEEKLGEWIDEAVRVVNEKPPTKKKAKSS
jgi:DNA transformation protein